MPTPEEVEARAHVECYREGKPSVELQYLIYALKIIDELRAEITRLRTAIISDGYPEEGETPT